MSLKSGPSRVSRREILRRLGVAGAAGTALLAPEKAQAVTYPSKIWTISGQDAFILADNGVYYQYVASGRGIGVRQSLDLTNWSAATQCFTIPSGGWMLTSQAPWAPEVHLYNGIYYLFTTLHNSNDVIALSQLATTPSPYSQWNSCWRRATTIAESSSPLGPFIVYDPTAPVMPPNFDCLDGTFIVDAEGPWMVFMHEWLTKIDGTCEAIPLTPNLRAAAGPPVFLFKASDAAYRSDPVLGAPPGLAPVNNNQFLPYVTDGCELYFTPSGYLLCIYSSYGGNYSYSETCVISKSGSVRGPWEQVQLEPYLSGDRGHGMIFSTFDGNLTHVVMNQAASGGAGNGVRSEYYEVAITDNGVKVLSHRADLDGQLGMSLADTAPPDLYLPPNLVANATSPTGAVVNYTASAFDWHDGAVALNCSMPSGSMFPIGDTLVTCSAHDAAENVTSGSFNVHVNAVPTIQCTGGYFIVQGLRATVSFNVSYPDARSTFAYNFRSATQTVQFASAAVSQISVTGKNATFAGQGKLNGVVGYSFTVTATDGGPAGSGLDSLSIGISGPNGYSYSVSSSITGGDVVIHS